jgi:preprotein translocase subunit YajC
MESFGTLGIVQVLPIAGITGMGIVQLLPIVAIFVIFYFLLIRPQKKKEKQVTSMRDAAQVGDDIVTIGGIRGRIVKAKDDVITIQVGADKVRFEIMRWAISKVETDADKAAAKATAKTAEKEKTADDEEQPTSKRPRKLGAKTETSEDTTSDSKVSAETDAKE